MNTVDEENRPTPLRIALIGCGKMGLQHLKAIAGIPEAVVVAVADPAADADAVRMQAGPDCRLYADAARMLAESAPDVVHVVTPPSTHAALALLALEKSCHVYVEKPFATTAAEARLVLAAAAAGDRKVCAGHQCLFEDAALRGIEMLGDIGRIVHATSYFSFRKVRPSITAAEQCKDILPHAVYPLLRQLRGGLGPGGRVEIGGCEARASGELHALLRVGEAVGIVQVSLGGRPIEQYQEVVGSNGSLRIDYVSGSVVRLAGPGTGAGVLFTPYRRARQLRRAATRFILRAIAGKAGSYGGLEELFRRFYASIAAGGPPPVPDQDILDTVDVCERLGNALDEAERSAEAEAELRLRRTTAGLPPTEAGRSVLVTGGTGFLGRRVAAELRHAGHRTRVVARRVPPPSRRVAGVEYVAADLAAGPDPRVLEGIDTIVHCAAETSGGRLEHERNSVLATRRLMQAAAAAGIRRVVHVSSIAVIAAGRSARRPVDEHAELVALDDDRGPYVWGKAESEREARRLAAQGAIDLRVIRPGPLVDYREFTPPGRLGRELGPVFVAIGGRQSPLAVCDVATAACVIRSCVEDFSEAPAVLNLVEGPPPTRIELMQRYRATRPDLRVWWIPRLLLRMLNGPAKLAQRLVLGMRQPVDLYAAFASGHYRTDLAESEIRRAGPSRVRES